MTILSAGIIGDDTAPTPVSNLQATEVNANDATLTWDPAQDDGAITEYNVGTTQNEIMSQQTTNTSISIAQLDDDTEYTFTVSAVDDAGNEGPVATVTVTTLDTTAPSAPTELTASNITASSVDLAWTAPPESDVDHYVVYTNGS